MTVFRHSPSGRTVKPAIMLQGTCSNAGKSLLTAGLCRLLARRGLRVAPFKAQNMALNSFVTAQGEEMGRAQALQAAACGLQADVRMNPVLLKPTSQVGSQVIVLGHPVGQMRVGAYLRYKPEAWKAVRQAYAALSAENDVMVLEGAGSPAEINLRAHDIVNMRMAREARAHVLLVADIDRGGAFAALAGTMALLTRAEKARVAGFILNKFRGDASLLDPALSSISRRTRRPFLGVMPMLEDLRLPEEDSVSFKLGLTPGLSSSGCGAASLQSHGQETGMGRGSGDVLDVVVIDLPHISNATDLDALRAEEGLRLRVVVHAAELGQPHCIILPGSRNTLADMAFLQRSGLAQALRAYALTCQEQGRGRLVGICGGLQMLGLRVDDPLHLEEGGSVQGLGLLELVTTLGGQKCLRRSTGQVLPLLLGQTTTAASAAGTGEPAPALTVQGYEIHHGHTQSAAEPYPDSREGQTVVVMRDASGEPLGWGRVQGGQCAVWGSYLHGVFDADAFRHAFCNGLRREFGLPEQAGAAFELGPELDRLADAVEQHLDMPRIYALLGL